MTTTEVLLKPESASFVSSTPVTNKMAMAPRKADSAGIFVKISTANIPNTVTIVIHA